MDQSRELGFLSRGFKWMVAVFQRCACRGIGGGGRGLLGVEEAELQRWASLLPGKPIFFFKISSSALVCFCKSSGVVHQFLQGSERSLGVLRGVRGALRL